MAAGLSNFKKAYRARFCHGGGKKIDVQPGQNVMELVQDCFENFGSDGTISSPSDAHCSTSTVRNKTTSVQSQRPKAELTNSVKRACNSAESLPASPLKPIGSRGCSHDSPMKPAICDNVAVSKKTKSPVSKRETKITLGDFDIICESPAMSSDSEDDHGCGGSPLLVKEASSPVHTFHFGDQNAPAAAKNPREVENLEGLQAGRDEQAVLMQRAEHTTAFTVQKEKSFSSVILAAASTGMLGKRYSASVSPPSPPLVKDQEIENECEFLIDESCDWISIPQKNKKSKKDTSPTPVPKSQPFGKEKTEKKKDKTRKVPVEALNKQKEDDLDVRVHDFKGGSESDPVSNSKGKVFTSQRQNRTDTGKTEKAAVRQGSPKDVSETKASDAEQRKAKVVPSKDLPVPSAEHQQELSPKKNLRSSKNQQGSSKASQHLVHEKQTAQQKLPEDTVTKRLAKSPRKKLKKSVKKSSSKQPRLERVFPSSSESEAGEEEVEREPVKLNEECIPLLPQELQTSVSQKSGQSEKPNNVLHPLEALGADNKTLVKALEYLIDSVKNSEKKRLPAESSREIPKSICHRTSEGVCSDSESAESQADSDSCSVQDVANKNQKLPDVKRKSNRRKRDVQHERQVSITDENDTGHASGCVLDRGDKLAFRSESCEEDNVSPVNSENLDFQASALLSDSAARQKIVMPTNTPNVRRTKRIRLRPLEYWRGERVNYTVNPSGNLVVSGIVCPETEPPRKIKQKRDGHKQKKDEKRSTTPAYLDHTLADTSKKTTVLNPVTNTEVLLRCVNTDIRHKCFYKDEAVEVYKNLSTSAFATGRLILKPFKEKGRQFVHMDTVAFHILHGKIIFTLHNTSYSLTTGSCFYVPAGNEYNIRNLDEESVLVFTQLKVNKNT